MKITSLLISYFIKESTYTYLVLSLASACSFWNETLCLLKWNPTYGLFSLFSKTVYHKKLTLHLIVSQRMTWDYSQSATLGEVSLSVVTLLGARVRKNIILFNLETHALHNLEFSQQDASRNPQKCNHPLVLYIQK